MSSHESTYPGKLKPGDTIGIAAPASHFDNEEFNRGLGVLHEMGFNTHVPGEVWDKQGFFAGSDDARADQINRLFEDTSIKGVICARGGYGSLRILEKLDFRLVRENPKIFVGFSDISALLTAFFQKTGLVCLHGPVVTTLGGGDKKSVDSLKDILVSGAVGRVVAEDGSVVAPGRAEGRLAGGNLSTLCHLLGTEFAPDFNNRIVFLEDVGEAPYRIDRMLTQMRLAGVFNGVMGLAVGSFSNCGSSDEVLRVFEEAFADFSIPIVSGFSFGHSETNLTLPVGAEANLDSDSLTLDFG